MGWIINIIGIFIVVWFTKQVDWTLWASIPVGIVIAAFAALLFGYLRGRLQRA